jgi:hypothetical protein
VTLLIKIACIVGLLILAGIILVHLLPWIIAILAIMGLVKLYHALTRPKKLPPTNWPWKEKE